MLTGSSGSTRLWRVATPLLAVVAAVLGFVGYGSYLGGQQGFGGAGYLDRAYYTLQLFVFGPSPFGGPPYGVALGIARFLAPLSTGLAVVQAVLATLQASRGARALRRSRGHDVVVGRTPEAFALAQNLARRGRTVLVGSGTPADVAARHGVHVVEGDPVDEEALRAAGVPGAARVFALGASGAANAAVALHVRALHASSSRPVSVHARVDDPELVAAMRARRLGAEGDGGFRVDFFSIETIAAIALLDQHPPAPDTVVVGSDRFARAVHRELVRRRRHAGGAAPGALVSCEEAAGLPAAASTYVCAGEPDDVLRIGLTLLLAGHAHVVLCLGRRAALAGALEKKLFDRVLGRLSVFGVLDTACDPEVLTANTLIEQLARALHKGYLDEYATPGSTRASHRPWETLAESYRGDNREHAADIGARLAGIDAIVVPAAERLPPFAFRPAEVDTLAALEHERWTAARKRAGSVLGPERTATTHPDLLPWAELGEDVREKNRTFIRRLPALLAAEDLAIVRRAR